MRGVHAGAIVFGGVLVANLGNYGFQLISARELGPASYSDLATLLAIVSLIGLPLGGLQLWVARHVAEYEAAGKNSATHWFVRRSASHMVTIGAVITAVFLIASDPVRSALGIASLGAVVIAAALTFPAILTPIVWGLAQGLERFTLISAMVAAAPTLRVALALAGFALGMGVLGAMTATLVSNVVALVIPLWLLRTWTRPAVAPAVRIPRREAIGSLLPVLVGLLAITALTTVDVVVAKRTLSDHETGIYSSASLVGRVILYLPSAIVTVLLPRVAARAADSRASLDLLGRSLAVTLGFCAAATAIYALIPTLIIRIAFGADYLDAEPLLWRFGVAMTGFAILNVLFVYHLGR
jgi:O-antigen/teichoic acid export membrane protein